MKALSILLLSITLICISRDAMADNHIGELSIERMFASPSLDGTAPIKLKVSPDGKRVTFLKGKETDYERYDLWEFHRETGKTQLLVDSDSLHSGDEALSDEEKARRERMRLSGSGIVDYTWSEDSKAILFPLAGDAYLYTLATDGKSAKVTQLLETPEFETDIRLSPKGNFIGFIRDQNLYVKPVNGGKEKAITTQGGGNIKFGMAEFVAQEEMGRLTGYWFSPDEKFVAFTGVDENPVDVITRSEIYADEIKLVEQKYPRAGTPNAKVSLFIQNIENSERKAIPLSTAIGKTDDFYFNRGKWASSSLFSFQVQTRNQQHLALNIVDVETFKVRNVLNEYAETWINLHEDLYFLKDGSGFIWASERTGFKHLYLFSMDGEMRYQLTKGDWVVTSLDSVDEKAEKVFFSGRYDTPTENHLYSVNFNGTQLQRISGRDGFHNVTFSQSGDVYVDRFSTINTPPQVSLHNTNGRKIAWLDQNKVDTNHPLFWYTQDWIEPTYSTIYASDGAELHYRLYTPKNLQEKHPVIVYVYGGPGVQVVTNRWAGRRGLLFQYWAQQGYVVFTIDNRGSKYRGKDFEDPIYKAMGDIEVSDQIEGVKFLSTLPYVDKSRIGIYGHSYGGYMALMTMFKAGDYFAAGVSGAPVTDWRLYDTHYTERYMGNPIQDEEAYTASSVFPYAKNLTGDLLIYHGMADDNVLFTHSTMLYKHLQDNAKAFEVMDYPGKKHSIRGKQTGIHLYNTVTNFFNRNLKPHN